MHSNSKEPFSLLDLFKTKKKITPPDKVAKYPNYVSEHNFIQFKDTNKIQFTSNVVSYNEYEKATFTDEIIQDLDSMIIPIISKINNTLKTKFNKDNIDYKKVIIKIDDKHNTMYKILVLLFQKHGSQQELKIEIHKDNTGIININEIKKISGIHSLSLINKENNNEEDYITANFGSDVLGKEEFNSKMYYDKKINKNIDKISKFYNLESVFRYPTIDEKLYDFDIPDKNAIPGYKHKNIDFSKVDFKINSNGIQEKSSKYNSWFIDKEKEKNITKIFPKNKVSTKWDNTGTLENNIGDEKDGLDYAYEKREKIPKFHISQYAHLGNNGFNNFIK